MTGRLVTVSKETPVAEVARTMVQGRVGSAVIMQGAWLVGIVTERDVLRAAASGEDLNASPISKWMTNEPMTAPPEMDSEEAAQIMVANGFRHLPVVEGRDVKGVVSIRDVLSARIRRRAKA
jgi:CBS domain-containing protein